MDTSFLKVDLLPMRFGFTKYVCPFLPVETVVLFLVNYKQFPGDRVVETPLALCRQVLKCYGIIGTGNSFRV